MALTLVGPSAYIFYLLHRDAEGLALWDDEDRYKFLARGAPYIFMHMLGWDVERRPWL